MRKGGRAGGRRPLAVLVGGGADRANCAAADGIPLSAEERGRLMSLTETEAYGRYIDLMSEQNPHALRDWRQAAAV